MQHGLAISLVCAALQACSCWPQASQGGVAELRPSFLGDEVAIEQLVGQLSSVKQAVADLRLAGLSHCLPGAEHSLAQVLTGVERELHAGMLADAEQRLCIVKKELPALQCRLQAIKHNTGCAVQDKGVVQMAWFLIPRLMQCEDAMSLAVAVGVTLLTEALFDTDSHVINPIYFEQLQGIADFLNLVLQAKVTIVGHADARASDAYNDVLSQRRAASVMQYLFDHGVDAQRMGVVAAGEASPRTSNHSIEGRQLNRRVEIRIEALTPIKSPLSMKAVGP